MTIATELTTKISRPLDNMNAVSIAELAIFTTYKKPTGLGATPIADADAAIRREMKWEVQDCVMTYLDFDSALISFADGSRLKISK